MKCMNNDIVHYFMIHVVFVFLMFTPEKRHFLYRLRHRVASIQCHGCCCAIGLSFSTACYKKPCICQADCFNEVFLAERRCLLANLRLDQVFNTLDKIFTSKLVF